MIDSFLILPDSDVLEVLLARRTHSSVETSRGDIDALAPRLSSPYAVILPGQRVRAFLTDLPDTIKGVERLNIVRFAHEDRIATDLSDLHIVVGSGDPAPTLMVSRDVMDMVLDRLDPQTVLADFDALTGIAGGDIALLDRAVSPGPQGMAVDADWAEGPVTLLDDDTLARAIFTRLDSGDGLDLRSGAYRRRTQIQVGPWARVVAVAMICVLLEFGLSFADARVAVAQADALRHQARTLYTQATGQPASDNLARLARTTPSADTDPAGFLVLSNVLFAALSNHPDIVVERLSFEARENSLRLRLVYPGFGAPSALEKTVAASGAVFTTGGVREQGGRFIGDAAISLGEAR